MHVYYVCAWYLQGLEESVVLFGTGIIDWKLWVLDLNPHPLSERQVFLIAEPSLHPWLHTFLKESSLFLLSDIFLPVDVQWSYGLRE